MTTARRRDGGKPLHDALYYAGVSHAELARRTKEIDGKGVSTQLIGFLASNKSWARTTTTPHTAYLIETALDQASGALFEVDEPDGDD